MCLTLCNPTHGLGNARHPSFIISWSLLRFTSTESVLLSNHLILCCLFLLLPSVFPSIRIFSEGRLVCNSVTTSTKLCSSHCTSAEGEALKVCRLQRRRGLHPGGEVWWEGTRPPPWGPEETFSPPLLSLISQCVQHVPSEDSYVGMR